MAGVKGRSGRKPTREKYARPVNAAEKKIVDRLPEIVDAMIDLSIGIQVQARDKEGNEIVYDQPPCVKAGIYLMDRILGKPVQPLGNEDGTPLAGAQVLIVLPDNGRSANKTIAAAVTGTSDNTQEGDEDSDTSDQD